MGENTAISWADHTFNPWIGCMKISPACDGCYADAQAGEGGRFPRAKWGGAGLGVGTRTRTKDWSKPLKWNREAAAAPGRTFVFCASLADVFDNAVPAEWRRDLFDLIRATPNLTWLLLTKRPGNIVAMARDCYEAWREPLVKGGMQTVDQWWPRNAAIGCTVVTQAEADRDIPELLFAKSLLRPAFAFVSLEPLISPVDLTPYLFIVTHADDRALQSAKGLVELPFNDPATTPDDEISTHRLDWVITGGETDQGGHQARPSHPTWFTSVRDQCAGAQVPFHHKQHGEWAPVCWMAEDLTEAVYHPAPARDPEAIRRCRVEQTVMNRDGSLHPRAADPETYHAHHGSMLMFKVGKRRSGRAIDGVVHDARPEVRQ